MRDRVDAATSALEQTPPAVEKARTLLKEGEKLITLRQKNILIADRSEHQSARRGKKISLRDYVIINWPCECARFGIATVLACFFLHCSGSEGWINASR